MRISIFIFIAFLLCLGFCNCRGHNNYDARLAAVDSALDHDNAAEAKCLFDSIKSVSGKANKAYYALLKTIVNYRNYIDDTTDAVINEALEYYRANKQDRYNYARSLLYKGIVSSLMHKDTEAMRYLKDAEAECDTTDYYLLGYIKVRIADRYQQQYTMGRLGIDKYLEAAEYFRKCNNMRLHYYCKRCAGDLFCRERSADSALILLNEVDKQYPQIIEERCYYENRIALAFYYASLVNDYTKSKDIIVDVINNGQQYHNSYSTYYFATLDYARLHQPDSAIYYYNKLPNDTADGQLFCHKMFLRSEIELSKHNYNEFAKLSIKARNLSDSLLTHSLANELREIETKYDKSQLELEAANLKNETYILYSIVILVIISCGIYFFWLKYKATTARAEMNSIIAAYEMDKEIMKDLAKHNSELNNIAIHHFEQIGLIVKTINLYNSNQELELKKLHKKFDEYLQMTFDDGFWSHLETYVNSRYHNFSTEMKTHPANLSDADINYLNLEIAGFPKSLTTYLLKFSTIQVCYNKRRRIEKRLNISNVSELFSQYTDK